MGCQRGDEMSAPLAKPGYSLSRRAFWYAFWLAWACIIAMVVGAARGHAETVAIAPIIVPSMVALIVALLGVHRAFGAIDMRTIAGTVAPPAASSDASAGGQ